MAATKRRRKYRTKTATTGGNVNLTPIMTHLSRIENKLSNARLTFGMGGAATTRRRAWKRTSAAIG